VLFSGQPCEEDTCGRGGVHARACGTSLNQWVPLRAQSEAPKMPWIIVGWGQGKQRVVCTRGRIVIGTIQLVQLASCCYRYLMQLCAYIVH
jgi:hypothetical protein